MRSSAAHDKALAACVIRLIATVSKAALTDPRVAFEFLARRFPARSGRTQATASLDDLGDLTLPTAEAPIALDPALLDELVPRLLEAGRRLSGRSLEVDDVDVSTFEDDGSIDGIANDHDGQLEQETDP